MTDPVAPVPVDDIEVEQNGAAAAVPVLAPPPVPIEASEEADEAIEARDLGDEDDAVVEPPKAAKPRNSIQAKIDQAVARQREAERRAEAAEQRLAQQSRPAETAKPEPTYTRAKPSENEIGSKYADYPAYIEDLTDWKLEQRDAQQAERDIRRATSERHEAHAAKFSERIAKAEEADPAFWSKISKEIAELAPSTAYDPADIQKARDAAYRGDPGARSFLSRVELADAIFDSDHSTDLMAHFSANTQDFQRLSTLPPKLIAREIGRLEASFVRSETASSGPVPKTPVISQAPPPIKPVGTTASTASEIDLNPDDMSEAEMDKHIRAMNARDKKTGQFTRRR